MSDFPGGLTDKARPWVVFAGLSMLIPLPLVDDLAATWCTRRALRELAAERGHALSEEAVRLLIDDPFSLAQGCFALLKWPFKKLFRTVLYFLTVKDVVDRTADAALRLELAAVALEAGLLPDEAPRVRAAMDEVLRQYHTSPVLRLLLRDARPALPHLDGPLGWIAVQAGAGLVLPRFLARIRP